MKKLFLALFCTLAFALPVYADSIITAPIDGRPISKEYLGKLAELGSDQFYTVSDKNLDFFSSYEPDNHLGNSQKVREEIYNLVSQKNSDNTTVIINTSSYITNGLVGSRCGINSDNYRDALKDLDKLMTDFNRPTYYVNLSVPRSLPETRFNKIWVNDDKMRGLSYYYLKYNKDVDNYNEINSNFANVTPEQYIMEFSYVYNKASEIGEKNLTQWEKDFLNNFNKNIKTKAPYKEYVDYYIKPYETTAIIFSQLLKYQQEGKLAQIVVSNDDLQIPNSITYFYNNGCDWVQTENGSPIKYSYARTYMQTGASSIQRKIIDTYSKIELGRANTGSSKFVNIIYGTDEVPQLIYARDYTRRKYLTPQLTFLYNDTQQNVATYDVKQPGNIARAAYAFVKGDVGKYTKNPAFVYIYDYKINMDKTSSAIERLKSEKKRGANVGLIELFDGTKENTAFQSILQRRYNFTLADLDMYSAWNTNGNAIGLGIAHCQVTSIAKEATRRPAEMLKAQTAILTQHAVEDGIYTKKGKLALNNKGYRPNVADRTNSDTLYSLMDTSKVTNGLKGKSFTYENKTYTVSDVNINKLSFPWGRTFDIYVGCDVKL